MWRTLISMTGGARPEAAGRCQETAPRRDAGYVLRHARSIGTKGCGRNFATGWAVGWAVCPVTACKSLKELVGASGFEPPASWSRTRRSTRLSHAPNPLVYPVSHRRVHYPRNL